MQRGSHKRSHNHVLEVGLARACDQQQTQVSSEVRVKFEQAGMSVCGRLLGCQMQQKVQRNGHARVRQRICGRLAWYGQAHPEGRS